MNPNDTPEGYFITWTVYGTFLQGDARWWSKRLEGQKSPEPLLEQWHKNRLNHDIILLTPEHRDVVHGEIATHSERRNWRLWAVNARSNHVHVVVSAQSHLGTQVRDQLKANCTRGLRDLDSCFRDRPVWSSKGDVRFLKTDDDVESAVVYVGEAQDQVDRGK